MTGVQTCALPILALALAQEIGGKEKELLRLGEDEKALQRLLSEIVRSLADIPPEIEGEIGRASCRERV